MEGSEQISLATLRAELASLELRIVDRIEIAMRGKADQAVVEEHGKRLTSLELTRAANEQLPHTVTGLENRLSKLERFRYTVPSVAVISCLAAVVMAAVYLMKL